MKKNGTHTHNSTHYLKKMVWILLMVGVKTHPPLIFQGSARHRPPSILAGDFNPPSKIKGEYILLKTFHFTHPYQHFFIEIRADDKIWIGSDLTFFY